MSEGVLIAVQRHQHHGLRIEIIREINLREAKECCEHLIPLPGSLIENGNLKEVVRSATALRSALYTFSNHDADRVLSFIENMRESDFES